jgi:flagellar motor switch protein FliG
MSRIDGMKQAIELLNALGPKERKSLLENMRKRDPKMTAFLEENLLSFEDLKNLSVKQLAELLREINIPDLALGLRIGSQALKTHILNNVSSRIREEIEQVLLGPPQPVNKVEEAVSKVMVIVKNKVEKGELVLSEDDELV